MLQNINTDTTNVARVAGQKTGVALFFSSILWFEMITLLLYRFEFSLDKLLAESYGYALISPFIALPIISKTKGAWWEFVPTIRYIAAIALTGAWMCSLAYFMRYHTANPSLKETLLIGISLITTVFAPQVIIWLGRPRAPR